MLGSINQIYTVICLPTNFQGGLVKSTVNGQSDSSDDILAERIQVSYRLNELVIEMGFSLCRFEYVSINTSVSRAVLSLYQSL